MNIDEAIEVLKKHKYRSHPTWALWADGTVLGTGGFDTRPVALTEFEAVAIARELERRAAETSTPEPTTMAYAIQVFNSLKYMGREWRDRDNGGWAFGFTPGEGEESHVHIPLASALLAVKALEREREAKRPAGPSAAMASVMAAQASLSAGLVWRSEPPDQNGWWWRLVALSHAKPQVVYCAAGGGHDHYPGDRWAGPIPEPVDPWVYAKLADKPPEDAAK